MKHLSVLFCCWSGLAIAGSELDLYPMDKLDSYEKQNDDEGCTSIVCNNVIKPESVNMAGGFPKRSKNETLSALGSVAFFAGEIGLAENLQEEEPELTTLPE